MSVDDVEKVNPGAQLASMRTVVSKPCAWCGNEISGIKKRLYCTESCKQKAKRDRINNAKQQE